MSGDGGYQPRGTRVYVGGLNEEIKKEDLELEFEKYGTLNSVWVAFNPPGFAFIEFASEGEAESACESMNGSDLMGSKLRVEISRGRGRGGARGGRGGFRGDRGGGGGGGGRGYSPRGGGRGYGGGGGSDENLLGRGGPRGGGGRGRYRDDYQGGGGDYNRGGRGDGGGDSGNSRYRSRSPLGRGR